MLKDEKRFILAKIIIIIKYFFFIFEQKDTIVGCHDKQIISIVFSNFSVIIIAIECKM